MIKRTFLAILSVGLFILMNAQDKSKSSAGALQGDTSKPKKIAGITDKVKASRKTDGLFTVYQDTANGSMQLLVRKNQLGKEYIYQSFSINGPTSLYLNQSMHRANMIFKIKNPAAN